MISIESCLVVLALLCAVIAILTTLLAGLTLSAISDRTVRTLLNIMGYSAGLAIGFGGAAAAFAILD